MSEDKNKPIFSLSAKDFRWEYYRGSGKGGQARNKTDNCVRCTHPPSGVAAYAEDGRSKEHNKKEAFRKVCEHPDFKQWVRIESMRKLGTLREIEEKIENDLKFRTKIEAKDENGRWIEVKPEQLTDGQERMEKAVEDFEKVEHLFGKNIKS